MKVLILVAFLAAPSFCQCFLAPAGSRINQRTLSLLFSTTAQQEVPEEVDVVVIGAGFGGLTCAALLGKFGELDVACIEAHTQPGGCAHTFERRLSPSDPKAFCFESGPTIYSGLSSKPFNPLRQVLDLLEEKCECIDYPGWGNITPSGSFHFTLGDGAESFRNSVLPKFGGPHAVEEFDRMMDLITPLADAASSLPPFALRDDRWSGALLLRFLPELARIIPYGRSLQSVFGEVLDAVPITDPFLYNWLDLLAFALSGLPAETTLTATMAVTLRDLHQSNAKLNYPVDGADGLIQPLVRSIERSGGKLILGRQVAEIIVSNNRALGVVLRDGRRIMARRAVVSNASIWDTAKLLPEGSISPADRAQLLRTPATQSFGHLHIGFRADGIDPSVNPHYTVVNEWDRVDGQRNMICVSFPTMLSPSLAPEGYHIIHAYCAGNEPYEKWEGLDRRSPEYQEMKDDLAKCLWAAVEKIIPDIKSRVCVSLVGSPLTHERFLLRSYGSYGPAYDPRLNPAPRCNFLPIKDLLCCGDSTFPGIGVPAVALSGATAAFTLLPPWKHWNLLSRVEENR
jgi:phytoene dehydrogenase-like protein